MTEWNGARPLDWYRLIHQAEWVREHYWLGLASVWGHINEGDYDAAATTWTVCLPTSLPGSGHGESHPRPTHDQTYRHRQGQSRAGRWPKAITDPLPLVRREPLVCRQ